LKGVVGLIVAIFEQHGHKTGVACELAVQATDDVSRTLEFDEVAAR
jgi:hypothetical protein